MKMATQERDRLRVLRFKKSGGELKNLREISEVKRTIARILTIVKEQS